MPPASEFVVSAKRAVEAGAFTSLAAMYMLKTRGRLPIVFRKRGGWIYFREADVRALAAERAAGSERGT